MKPLELLLEDDGLKDFYDLIGDSGNPDEFLRLCAHSKPTLKILEVGAGTGSFHRSGPEVASL